MKKIVILGAGIYQVPLIKRAKERGLYVIVVSIPGKYPGFSLADKVYYVNTTDKEAVLKLSLEEKIDAILTTGTDVAVSTIGYVCEKMGLHGISEEAANIVTDKAKMKEAFKIAGVNSAIFERVTSKEEAIIAANNIGYPVMVKIVDKSGSRGITKVFNDEEVEKAYEFALDNTNADHMIVEKFIEGEEIGVDAFVQNGEIKFIIPHNKLVYKTKRTGIPMGHICPMEMSDKLKESVISETTKAIKGTGLDNCAVNLDVFVTSDDTISVIEVAGRCGATGIPEVLGGFIGRNYYDMIIDNAFGISVDRVDGFTGKPTASMLLRSPLDGELVSVRYCVDGVVYENEPCRTEDTTVGLDYNPGDHVYAFEDGTCRIGQAVFCADTMTQLQEMISKFDDKIQVFVKEK